MKLKKLRKKLKQLHVKKKARKRLLRVVKKSRYTDDTLTEQALLYLTIYLS